MMPASVDDDERCKLNLPRQGATWMLTENSDRFLFT